MPSYDEEAKKGMDKLICPGCDKEVTQDDHGHHVCAFSFMPVTRGCSVSLATKATAEGTMTTVHGIDVLTPHEVKVLDEICKRLFTVAISDIKGDL